MNRSSFKIGSRNRTIRQELKIGPVSVKFITITLFAVVALFYLMQTSQASGEKYKLMQLNGVKTEVENRNKELEVEAARLKSLNNIKESAQSLNLEPIQKTGT